jgi:hypothetical protein
MFPLIYLYKHPCFSTVRYLYSLLCLKICTKGETWSIRPSLLYIFLALNGKYILKHCLTIECYGYMKSISSGVIDKLTILLIVFAKDRPTYISLRAHYLTIPYPTAAITCYFCIIADNPASRRISSRRSPR